jgi:tryptophan synthase alpha chain
MKRVNNYSGENMNRINKLMNRKQTGILSVYFTAGYPFVDSTAQVVRHLADAGVDMIEIGMPFSDPLADGPVIQHSSNMALRNGMSLKLLFSQLKGIREKVEIPLLLMGYLNPVMQFGIENFCRCCSETGIDGTILPDLPPEVYLEEYKDIFQKYDLNNILLVTPMTSDNRIRMIDGISSGFIYLVSSASTTGIKEGFSEEQISYFKRIRGMKLKNKCLIGFGISDHRAFDTACVHANGAIIGSAFVKIAGEKDFGSRSIEKFIREISGV